MEFVPTLRELQLNIVAQVGMKNYNQSLTKIINTEGKSLQKIKIINQNLNDIRIVENLC